MIAREIVPLGIGNAGDPEAVQLVKEGFRARHRIRQRGLREPLIQGDNGGEIALHPARHMACTVALDPAISGQVRILCQSERCKAAARQQRSDIGHLHIDRVTRRRRLDFGLCGQTLFVELLCIPAAGHDDPVARMHAQGDLTQPRQCLCERGRADPVHVR